MDCSIRRIVSHVLGASGRFYVWEPKFITYNELGCVDCSHSRSARGNWYR